MVNSFIETGINNGYIRSIKYEKINMGKKLLEGTYSELYRATLGNQYCPVAITVKIIKSLGTVVVDEELQRKFINELKQLHGVECHPNILNLWGMSKDPDSGRYMMVMEYADDGSLEGYLARNFDKLTGSEKVRLGLEIATGVAYLHNEDIVHGELNSSNVLVHQNHIKIGNLGLSKRINKEIAHSSLIIEAKLQYIDPQYFLKVGHVLGKKSDIYSLGVLLWELTSGKPAFAKLREGVLAHIIRGRRESAIDGTPAAFVHLYSRCWDQEPENRPEISQVCEALNVMEWFEDSVSTLDTESVASTTLEKEDIWNAKEIKLLDGATEILKRGLDSGKDHVTIGVDKIGDYLAENSKEKRGLISLLLGERDPEDSIHGNPYALLLGFAYYKGLGIAFNSDLAFKTFKESAKQDSYGEYFLALCYRSGCGTKVNKGKAFHRYKKSAESGNFGGQYELANCYREGDGTLQDPKQAFEWYKKSAEAGHAVAQRWLAHCYRRGLGTPKNDEEAQNWYQKSDLLGD